MGFVLSMSLNSNIWDVFWTKQVQMRHNVAGSWQVPFGNARDLQLECAEVLYETLLVHVLTYGSEKMLWKEKGRSRACLLLGGWIESLMHG